MYRFITILLFVFSFTVFAQSKADLKVSLDAMKAQGMITEEQYNQTLKELENMSDEDLSKIKSKAQEAVNDPEIMKKAKQVKLPEN